MRLVTSMLDYLDLLMAHVVEPGIASWGLSSSLISLNSKQPSRASSNGAVIRLPRDLKLMCWC